MKILIFISQLNKGGAERVVSNLSNYLINKHDVTIAVLRNRKPEYLFDNRIKIVFLENEIDSRKNKIFKLRIRYKNYVELIKNNCFDLVLCFLPEPSFIALLSKNRSNSKIVVSVRNDPKIEYKSLFRKFLVRLLYNKADGFVFQTNEAKNFFSQTIQNKSAVIMNSIDASFLCKPFDGEREKVIVTVGRLEKQKNHELLIKSFKNVEDYFPNYRLIIYGEGSERKKLENLISNLNLSNRILLPGKIDDVKDKIYKASLFVLSSDFEGMPNSLLEAMALGIPCISTDCPSGGPKSVIDNKVNGFLVPVNDINNLSSTIVLLLKDPFLRESVSQNASVSMLKYHPNKINKEWEKYIFQVFNDK